MSFDLELFSSGILDKRSEKSLAECNDETVNYGLMLSEQDIKDVITARDSALSATGRIEFGGGIVERLIYKFCDSPYIYQGNYAQIICELTEIFYYFKNETLDTVSDEDLLDAMKGAFDGPCAGSTELLASREMTRLARDLRYGKYGAGRFYDGDEEDEADDRTEGEDE